MRLNITSDTVVVFDLDDTLYLEHDYRTSGILSVIDFVRELYGSHKLIDLDDLISSSDFIATIVNAYKLPESVKESLLWIYRLHHPSIKLRPDVKNTINNLKNICKSLIILTDGRSITQRLKINALGLSHLPVYISEEILSEKPSPKGFVKIANEFKAYQYIYIADNPNKDFVAPNSLGWKTIGLRCDHRNIHLQRCDNLSADYLPHMWIDSLSELLFL
jgi:putative hydrolase of the HAD superfamily